MLMQKWIVLGSLIVGVLLAGTLIYAKEYSSPVQGDALRLEVNQMRSFNQEAAFIIEQKVNQKITNNYFHQQLDQLNEHAEKKLNNVRRSHPATGMEEKYHHSLLLFNSVVNTLKELSTDELPDLQLTALHNELTDTAKHLEDLKESL